MTLAQHTQQGLNELIGAGLTVDGDLGPATNQAILSLQNKLSDILAQKGYSPCSLIGIRMSDEYTNHFTDWGVLTVKDKTVLFPMSTKPGSSYQKNDAYVAKTGGCACLKEGQYKGVWAYHPAGGWSGDPYLQQVAPVTIYRDKSEGSTIDRSHEETGNFGINFHSWKGDNSQTVDNLSAGCQVEQEDVLLQLVPMIDVAGPISYTLIHFDDFNA